MPGKILADPSTATVAGQNCHETNCGCRIGATPSASPVCFKNGDSAKFLTPAEPPKQKESSNEPQNDTLNQLDDLLDLHFPDDPHPNGPSWHQTPYLDDLFNLSIQAYGIVDRDDVAVHVRKNWKASRQHPLPSDFERQLDRLVDAWGHWQFARLKLLEE